VQYFSSRQLEGYGSAFPFDGQMRAFARQGRDVFIAIAITGGVGIGVSALIVGLAAIQG
jgi:ABC-type lipoprotein release transport system permease subunit